MEYKAYFSGIYLGDSSQINGFRYNERRIYRIFGL